MRQRQHITSPMTGCASATIAATSAHGHPRRRQRQQRHREQVREVEPDDARRRFRRIAHDVVVIHPYDRDEQIADGVAQPGRPECRE